MPVFGAPPAAPLPYLILAQGSGTSVASSGSATSASLDVLRANGNGWPAPSLPASRFTFPVAGFVLVTVFDCDWGDQVPAIGTGYRALGRKLNNVTNTQRYGSIMTGRGGSAGNQTVSTISMMLKVAAGDTIDILLSQTSTSTCTVSLTTLSFHYIQVGLNGATTTAADENDGTGN